MAQRNVASDEVGYHGTLAAAANDTVTFDDRDLDRVTVMNRGAALLWFSLVEAAGASDSKSYPVLAGSFLTVEVPTSGETNVNVFSPDGTDFSVVV